MSTGGRDVRRIIKSQAKVRSRQEQGQAKKSQLSETHERARPGYVFMPLGTPELADLCKDLSQQRGLPVFVVNAKPAISSTTKARISNHIQRIGYHFKEEVVEEACTRLQYLYSDGKFVSEADLKQHSFIARVMAKHGLQATKLSQHETPEQLRGAIRELFPAIPDSDLDAVVKHAWDSNESRIGTATNIDLSRRIQLAVLARIRHTYTDYDILLKTFDWIQCRREVEPACLKKLLEWKGEAAGDGGLEELVADTMLIDEQSDAPHKRRVRPNRSTKRDHTSRASDGVVQQMAVRDSVQDLSDGYLTQPEQRSYAERYDIARQKIQEARQRLQVQDDTEVQRVHIATDATGQAPSKIVVNGKVLLRAPPETSLQPREHMQPRYQPVHGAPAIVQQASQHTSQQYTSMHHAGYQQTIQPVHQSSQHQAIGQYAAAYPGYSTAPASTQPFPIEPQHQHQQYYASQHQSPYQSTSQQQQRQPQLQYLPAPQYPYQTQYQPAQAQAQGYQHLQQQPQYSAQPMQQQPYQQSQPSAQGYYAYK